MGFKVEKADLLRFIEGYRKAEGLIREERRQRLFQLTSDESRLEYDALCAIWEATPKKEGMEALDRQRLSFLIERRERLDAVSGFIEGK
ncbi:MAG: hypothetical protein ACE5NJ_11105 [Thermodesulfobacteriota bacterium]